MALFFSKYGLIENIIIKIIFSRSNKYDKKVFAIPGKIDDKMSCGTNKLIKNGAKDSLDFRVEIHDQPLKVAKALKTVGPGEVFGMNVVINGKKLFEMEDPVMDKNVMEDKEMEAAAM